MTRAVYTGHEALTFTDYTDLDTGKTLHAEPRAEPYDIAPASGRLAGDIPEPWFVPAVGVPDPPPAPEPEAEAVPEAGAEPEAPPEPGTEEGQSF